MYEEGNYYDHWLMTETCYIIVAQLGTTLLNTANCFWFAIKVAFIMDLSVNVSTDFLSFLVSTVSVLSACCQESLTGPSSYESGT